MTCPTPWACQEPDDAAAPVWDVFKTLVFVVLVCGGVAALISWMK